MEKYYRKEGFYMKKQYEELVLDIADEEKAITGSLERLYQVRDKFNSQPEDYTTEPAMGTYLMNFYNGVENILKRVCKEYYGVFPKGESWHKELLILACNPPQNKEAVLDENIVKRLHAYRSFRHRFVSGYGFQLKGEKMLELIDSLAPLWKDVQSGLSDFLKKLESEL